MKDSLILISASVFCCSIQLKYMKKPQPHTVYSQKRKQYFNNLFRYLWISFCPPNQNSTSGLLKVSYNGESETLSIKFLYSATLKIHWSLLYFECIFFISSHDFVTSYIGHQRNIFSLNYADFPNVKRIAFYNIKKSHLLISLLTSSENSLGIGKLSSSQ